MINKMLNGQPTCTIKNAGIYISYCWVGNRTMNATSVDNDSEAHIKQVALCAIRAAVSCIQVALFFFNN